MHVRRRTTFEQLSTVKRRANTITLVQLPLQRPLCRSDRTKTEVPAEHTGGHTDRQIHLQTFGQGEKERVIDQL